MDNVVIRASDEVDPSIIVTGALKSLLSQNVYIFSLFVKDIMLNLKLYKIFSV